jgi:hypothetical protein
MKNSLTHTFSKWCQELSPDTLMNTNRRFALVLRGEESYGFENFKTRTPFWSPPQRGG